MLEKTVQQKILDFLKKKYPTAVVLKLSEETNVGIPDILFICMGKTIFIEVKRPSGGRRGEIQKYWVRKLKKNGVQAFFARSVSDVKKSLHL